MARRSKRKHRIFHRLGELLFTPRYKARDVEDFPQVVENEVVYIVTEGDKPDTLIFRCPCGCQEIIYLNLLDDTWPRWRFDVNIFGFVSIRPSIRRTVKCRSHFFITAGRVISC
jgi:hypothetical protein